MTGIILGSMAKATWLKNLVDTWTLKGQTYRCDKSGRGYHHKGQTYRWNKSGNNDGKGKIDGSSRNQDNCGLFDDRVVKSHKPRTKVKNQA